MNIVDTMIENRISSHIVKDENGKIIEVYARPKSVEQSLTDKLSDIDIVRSGAIVSQSYKFNQMKANLCTQCIKTKCMNRCNGLRALPTGNMSTQIMFLNRQPTDYETIMSASCSDRCGLLITLILDKMGIKRDSVYFTDIIKCNAKLNEESFNECVETYLMQEMDMINPKLIICNGMSTLKTCIARNIITDLSMDVSYGNIYTAKLPNGNSVKITAVYDLEVVLKKEGSDYSRCKNELWTQVNNAVKSIQ